jgi:protease II
MLSLRQIISLKHLIRPRPASVYFGGATRRTCSISEPPGSVCDSSYSLESNSLESNAGLAVINSEIATFHKYTGGFIEHQIQDIQNMIFDDYVATSASENSDDENESSYEVSGPHEYIFYREKDKNHSNLFRRPLPLSDSSAADEPNNASRLILDIDRLAKYYNRPISLVHLKLSEDYNLIAFVLEVINEDSSSSCDSYRQTKVLLKNIDLDVTCELELPAKMTPVDLEITSTPSGTNCGLENSLVLYISSSNDGIRPSSVHSLQLDPLLLFGKNKTFPLHLQGERRVKKKQRGTPKLSLRTFLVHPRDLTLLVEEGDPAYFLDLAKSKDGQYVLVHHHSKVSSEVSSIRIGSCSEQQEQEDDVMNVARTLIPRLKGQQCFVNHAHGCFYVAAVSSRRHGKTHHTDVSEELSIRSISSHSSQSCSDWSEWDVVWPSQRDVTGSGSGNNNRFILDDYDIFEKHILVYARDKQTNGDISIQLLEIQAKECSESQPVLPDNAGVKSNNPPDLYHVKLVKVWTGVDFRSMLESCHHSSGEGGTATEDYVWTVTPGANGNFDSKMAHFSLTSTVIPGE